MSSTIGHRLSSSARFSVSVRQIRPRPYLAMKFIASGVVNSAAMQKSPSFSLSSSSTSITMRPSLIWRSASSILSMDIFILFSERLTKL